MSSETLNAENMLTMLEDLVNIDSGSYDKAGVDQVGAYLKARYEQLGFTVTEQPNDEVGNHLIVRYPGANEPTILILAHMDTVFSKGTVAQRPFSVAGNHASGPGVIDMKASHVMLYYALKALIERGDDSYKNVEILLTSDEEIGSGTSRALIEARAQDKAYTLVVEPARADGSLVSARRGAGVYLLEVTGKAAHAGIEPENGRSAIDALARLIPKLHDLSSQEDKVNVNVGVISGGTTVNTVAAQAQAEIDVRISSLEQGEWIDEKIKAICQSVDEDITVKLTGGINRPPMVFTEETARLIRMIQDVAKEQGLKIGHVETGGGSDASFTSALNIPTVDGLGPVGGNQHSEQEYLEIDSLVPRTELFISVLSQLSKQ